MYHFYLLETSQTNKLRFLACYTVQKGKKLGKVNISF